MADFPEGAFKPYYMHTGILKGKRKGRCGIYAPRCKRVRLNKRSLDAGGFIEDERKRFRNSMRNCRVNMYGTIKRKRRKRTRKRAGRFWNSEEDVKPSNVHVRPIRKSKRIRQGRFWS